MDQGFSMPLREVAVFLLQWFTMHSSMGKKAPGISPYMLDSSHLDNHVLLALAFFFFCIYLCLQVERAVPLLDKISIAAGIAQNEHTYIIIMRGYAAIGPLGKQFWTVTLLHGAMTFHEWSSVLDCQAPMWQLPRCQMSQHGAKGSIFRNYYCRGPLSENVIGMDQNNCFYVS